MIKACGCLCGSTENLIRSFLQRNGYNDWLMVDVYKGKEASKRLIRSLPQYPELDMLETYVNNASKWAVIIGYNENGCRWADLTHGGAASIAHAKAIIETFA